MAGKKATHSKSTKPRGNRRKTAPQMVDAALSQTEALRLRQSGATFQQIADRLGYSDRSGAHRAVMAALKESVTEPNAEMRSLELSDLASLQDALWPSANAGDQGAVDRVLKIMERRAKILGLDAAPKLPQGDIDELIQQELERIAGLEASR